MNQHSAAHITVPTIRPNSDLIQVVVTAARLTPAATHPTHETIFTRFFEFLMVKWSIFIVLSAPFEVVRPFVRAYTEETRIHHVDSDAPAR